MASGVRRAELLAAIAVGGAVAAGVWWLVDRLVLPRPSYVPDALTALAAVGIAVVLVASLLRPGWSRWRTVTVWATLAALPAATLSLLLSGTRLYLNGFGGDQGFRTAYLARLTSSPALADMTYADLPPYYPAGWFWVAGRVTDGLGVEAWAAYKPLSVVTMGVAGALAYTAWSAVVGRRTAVPVAVACGLAGLRVAAYEPYAWVVAVLLPPVAVFAWTTLRAAARGERDVPAAVVLGAYLGVAAAVYSLLAAAAGLLGVVTSGVALAVHGPGRSWRHVLAVGGIAGTAGALVAAPVWAPYLLAGGAGAASDAQRYLPEVGAGFPLPFLEPSAAGVVGAVGLIWIVLRAARSPVAAGLALFVGTVYLWHALSLVALLAGSTLLPFRLEPPLLAALWVGAALAAVDGWRAIRRHLPEPRPALATVAVLAVVVTAGLAPGTRDTHPELVAAAFDGYTPDGERASGPPDPADPGAWNDELATTLRSATGREPAELVVLTGYYPLLAHAPYRAFQTSVPQYANPLADFDARRTEIEGWAGATDATDLLDRLDRCPFRPPTVFVLDRRTEGLYLALSADAFPRDPANTPVDVRFEPELFTGPAFARRDVGPFTVIVRAGG